MALPKIKIVMGADGCSSVSIDGHELKCVVAVNVRLRAARPRVRVFLQLIGDVEVQAEPSVVNVQVEPLVSDLGHSIAAAVSAELRRQKIPGGLLASESGTAVDEYGKTLEDCKARFQDNILHGAPQK